MIGSNAYTPTIRVCQGSNTGNVINPTPRKPDSLLSCIKHNKLAYLGVDVNRALAARYVVKLVCFVNSLRAID